MQFHKSTYAQVIVLAEDQSLAEYMIRAIMDTTQKRGVDALWLVGARAVLDVSQSAPSLPVVPIIDGAGRRRAHPGSCDFVRRCVQWIESVGGVCATSYRGLCLSLCASECAIVMRRFNLPCARGLLIMSPARAVAQDVAAAAVKYIGIASEPPPDSENGNGKEHGSYIRSDARIDVRRISFGSQTKQLCEHNDIEKLSSPGGMFFIQDEIQPHMQYTKHSGRKVTLLRRFCRVVFINGIFFGTEHIEEGSDITSSCPCEAKDFETLSQVFRSADEEWTQRAHDHTAAASKTVHEFVSQAAAFVAYASSTITCISCAVYEEEEGKQALLAYGATCMLPRDASEQVRTAFAEAVVADTARAALKRGHADAAGEHAPHAPDASATKRAHMADVGRAWSAQEIGRATYTQSAARAAPATYAPYAPSAPTL
jgi:hypothetical protein